MTQFCSHQAGTVTIAIQLRGQGHVAQSPYAVKVDDRFLVEPGIAPLPRGPSLQRGKGVKKAWHSKHRYARAAVLATIRMHCEPQRESDRGTNIREGLCVSYVQADDDTAPWATCLNLTTKKTYVRDCMCVPPVSQRFLHGMKFRHDSDSRSESSSGRICASLRASKGQCLSMSPACVSDRQTTCLGRRIRVRHGSYK